MIYNCFFPSPSFFIFVQLIEPSAGVGVAVALSQTIKSKIGLNRVGVILCGGNVDVTRVISQLPPLTDELPTIVGRSSLSISESEDSEKVKFILTSY